MNDSRGWSVSTASLPPLTTTRIKRQDPGGLVAINWACSRRMPEEPLPGIDYFALEIRRTVVVSNPGEQP